MPPSKLTHSFVSLSKPALFLSAVAMFGFTQTAYADNFDADPISEIIQNAKPRQVTYQPKASAIHDSSQASQAPALSSDVQLKANAAQSAALSSAKSSKFYPFNQQFQVNSSAGAQLAEVALDYLGIKYKWGGETPSTGFDCSGFIQYLTKKHIDMDIPRVAASQAKIGIKVDRSNLQPGDLVFFNTSGKRNSHVGIYLGDNKFVHAPRTGANVRVEKISSYWSKRYNGARRLKDPNKNTVHF